MSAGRRQTDEQLWAVAEALRDLGYIDLLASAPVQHWLEDVVEPVVDALRAAGWTVEPPSDDTPTVSVPGRTLAQDIATREPCTCATTARPGCAAHQSCTSEACSGTWPTEPGIDARPFHVRSCPRAEPRGTNIAHAEQP